MTDVFSVTGAFDKSSYATGDAMKVTITGDDVLSTGSTTPVHVVLQLTAADGATGTVTADAVLTSVVATHESVRITSVTDASGRVWAVDTGGLFATAVA